MRRQRSSMVWYSSRQSKESPRRRHSSWKEASSWRVTSSQAAMKSGRETLRGGCLRSFALAGSSASSGSLGTEGSQRMW
jgi:hypothetical protein